MAGHGKGGHSRTAPNAGPGRRGWRNDWNGIGGQSHGRQPLSVACRTSAIEGLGIDVRGVRCDVDHGQEARQAGDHRQHCGNELQARKSLQTGAQGSAESGLSFCPYGKTNRVLLAADRARSDARVVSAADRFGSVTVPRSQAAADLRVDGRFAASSGHWWFAGWGPQSSRQRTLAGTRSRGQGLCPRRSQPRTVLGSTPSMSARASMLSPCLWRGGGPAGPDSVASGVAPGVVPEESDHSRQRPKVRRGGPGLPVEDGRLVDPDPQRNLPLEESEVQAAFPDVVADRAEFRRVRSINGFRAFQLQIAKWQRRDGRAGSSGHPSSLPRDLLPGANTNLSPSGQRSLSRARPGQQEVTSVRVWSVLGLRRRRPYPCHRHTRPTSERRPGAMKRLSATSASSSYRPFGQHETHRITATSNDDLDGHVVI